MITEDRGVSPPPWALWEMFQSKRARRLGVRRTMPGRWETRASRSSTRFLRCSRIRPGMPGRVFADFGLTVEPVRGLVRERLGAAL